MQMPRMTPQRSWRFLAERYRCTGTSSTRDSIPLKESEEDLESPGSGPCVATVSRENIERPGRVFGGSTGSFVSAGGGGAGGAMASAGGRSEERRVGKECRCRWVADD